MTIKLVLADDHAVVRDGIKSVLSRKNNEFVVVGEAENGKELVDLADKVNADVYIVDISMPELNGLEATERIVRRHPASKVIILSMHDDRFSVEKALKAGAKGYIVKVSTSEDIIKAIRDVYNDKFYLCPRVSKYVVEGFLGQVDVDSVARKTNNLTPKEREILQLIAEGFSSKDIAQRHNLSLNTIHVHRNNIMRKLDIHKQADLIRYAIKEGIAHL